MPVHALPVASRHMVLSVWVARVPDPTQDVFLTFHSQAPHFWNSPLLFLSGKSALGFCQWTFDPIIPHVFLEGVCKWSWVATARPFLGPQAQPTPGRLPPPSPRPPPPVPRVASIGARAPDAALPGRAREGGRGAGGGALEAPKAVRGEAPWPRRKRNLASEKWVMLSPDCHQPTSSV